MLQKLLLCLLIALLSSPFSLMALVVINQTEHQKIVKIEAAYRPPSKNLHDLEAPIPYGDHAKKIKIAPHSSKKIPLNTNPELILFSVISEKTKRKKITTTTKTTCYQAYSIDSNGQESQQKNLFTDEWGFVIHQPIKDYSVSSMIFRTLKEEEEQGFGVKCLHPLLLAEVSSLYELPQSLKELFLIE